MTSEALRVRAHSRVQVADYPRGATFGPRVLPAYELVWLLRGSAEWRTELRDVGSTTEQVVALQPGMLALARVGNREVYRWDPARASSHAFVHFSVEDPGHLGDPRDWPAVRHLADAPILSALCEYLSDLAGQQSAWSRQRSDELVQLLLDLFVTGPLERERPQLPPSVRSVIEHVREVWAVAGPCIVPVEEMAAAACVSTGHLHRLFRGAFGCGPSHALELVRLARAAMALQRSNCTLAEVAARNGFSTPYHFSRRFSGVYGMPPGAFRRGGSTGDPLWPVRQANLLPVAHLLQ